MPQTTSATWRCACSRTSSSPAWTRALRHRALAMTSTWRHRRSSACRRRSGGRSPTVPLVSARRSYPPLYQQAADQLADDVLRLLVHREFIPRTVLVEYLKILFAFHLALYHLKIMKLLPALVRGDKNASARRRVLPRRHRPAGLRARHRLAERSAAAWFGRIPAFVRATFTVKKLDDFAEHLARRNLLPRPSGRHLRVSDLLPLLGPRYREERTALRGWSAERDRGCPRPRHGRRSRPRPAAPAWHGRVHHLRRGDHPLPGQVPPQVPDRVPGHAAAQEPARVDDRPAQGRAAPLHAGQSAA